MSSPDYSQAVKDIIDGLGDSPTPDAIYHAVRNYSVDHVVAASAAAAKAGGGGGGGSQPVTCQLLVTALDVSAATSHALVWDAIQDNPWDENALLAIPAGLGMSFAFDGTDSTLTTTEAGTWALSLYLTGAGDIDWYGHYDDGLWGQHQIVGSTYGAVTSNPRCIVSQVMKLPSGAQLQPAIVTDIAADASQTIDASLLLTRLA